jgi:hypothetical protein
MSTNYKNALFAVGIAFAFGIIMLFSGCSESQSQPVQQNDLASYKMPGNSSEVHTFVIDSELSEPMQKFVIEDNTTEADPFRQWQEWRAKSEAQDKYDTYVDAWSNDDKEKAQLEYDLECYCNGLFSNKCLIDLKEYCDHNGCRNVTVECKRVRDTDDVCVRYDITLGELE